MKIKIICIGKLTKDYYKNASNEYLKRLSRYAKFEVVELPSYKPKSNDSVANIKRIETKKLIDKAEGKIIALDAKGKQLDSIGFAKKIKEYLDRSDTKLTFLIGGSHGLDYNQISGKFETLSFSKLTFPHQLFRVFLVEQLYRSFSIINNSPYHK